MGLWVDGSVSKWSVSKWSVVRGSLVGGFKKKHTMFRLESTEKQARITRNKQKVTSYEYNLRKNSAKG